MASKRVAIITLGCARNEVDSDELAGQLTADGWTLVDQEDQPDAVLVNTCGFIDAAKQESIDTLLQAHESTSAGSADGTTPEGSPAVVAVGCMAERYGRDLAENLPEADAVLGFDAYPQISTTLSRILAGEQITAHEPTDRRELLPITPVDRQHAAVTVPGHGTAVRDGDRHSQPLLAPRRHRLTRGPVAPVKIASGCDRRCAFCAIPSFRGSFISRPREQIVEEVRELAGQGVREVVLVSENTTSYGKDLPGRGHLAALLRDLDASVEIPRIRLTYLQPAELTPDIIEAVVSLPSVMTQFDLPFQHAAGGLLRRMRRFGDADSFLDLIDRIRTLAPEAGIRSNVIVGFPGESEADLDVLTDFLASAQLDAIGVFGYSDEEGTEAAELDGKLDEDEIRARTSRVLDLAAELTAQRAEDRVGSSASVLIEESESGGSLGRAHFQGPEDGQVQLPGTQIPVGRILEVTLIDSDGPDFAGAPRLSGQQGDRVNPNSKNGSARG